jgi:DNA polymerase-3 subunit delta
MFKEKKLIILENVSGDKYFVERFLEKIEKYSKSQDEIIVVFEEGSIDSKNALNPLLKEKSIKTQEFASISGVKLKNWIKKEFEKYKIVVTPQIIQLLADGIGGNLWQLSNEIQKLATYKLDKGEVREEDVARLIRSKLDANIFKTIDAIAQGDKRGALYLLNRHLQKGDSPIYLLFMINMQFRNILAIKDLMEKNKPYAAILKETKLNPFVVKKGYWLAQRFSIQEIKKIYQKLFLVDLDIKTGKLNPEIALQNLIIDLPAGRQDLT